VLSLFGYGGVMAEGGGDVVFPWWPLLASRDANKNIKKGGEKDGGSDASELVRWKQRQRML